MESSTSQLQMAPANHPTIKKKNGVRLLGWIREEFEGETEDPPEAEVQDEEEPYLAPCGDPLLRLGEARAERIHRDEPPPPDYPDMKDQWFMNRDAIWCQHHIPRDTVSVLDESCPLPLQYLDVMRETRTDLPDPSEAEINDLWSSSDAYGDPGRELSGPWTGATLFWLRKHQPKLGWRWVKGRHTQIKSLSRRPGKCYG